MQYFDFDQNRLWNANMYLNIRNGTSKLIIFCFSIIKKSERIYLNIAGIPHMSSVTIFQSDHFVLSTNFLFKFNVSLPLVTGELLQNTVDVNNVTYKLYNIKLQRLPVLLNTKNYLSTGQAIT